MIAVATVEAVVEQPAKPAIQHSRLLLPARTARTGLFSNKFCSGHGPRRTVLLPV